MQGKGCISYMKSFFASVECAEWVKSFQTNLSGNPERKERSASGYPKMKSLGVKTGAALEIPKGIDYIVAMPQMRVHRIRS